MTPEERKEKLKSQILFEHLYNKNQIHHRLDKEFNIPEVIAHLERHDIPVRFGIDLLVTMVIHKRAPLSMLVAMLHTHFTSLQECADMITIAARHDLVDYQFIGSTFILRHDVTPDVYEELDQYQYPLPLLIPPRRIDSNSESGYYTFEKSVILKKNHHDDDVYLKHLNRCNSIPFTINLDTAVMVKNRWADLDHKRPNETLQEYNQRVKAFDKYDRASRAVIDKLVDEGNVFWLTHRYDKRGRCYCQGYHVTYQGNEWNKAVIEFAAKEIVQKS